MMDKFNVEIFNDEASYRTYLTPAGRASLNIPEFVHRDQLPGADSPCLAKLREIFGGAFAFDASKIVITPWPLLTKQYEVAKTAYQESLAHAVRASNVGTDEEKAHAVNCETKAANQLVIETRRAGAAVAALVAFLHEQARAAEKNA